MLYVGLGVVAFVIAGLLDLASLRSWKMAKPVIGLTTVGIWVYAFVGLLLASDRFSLQPFLIGIGWVIIALAMLLTLLSQFRDIPFHETYVGEGVGNELITTGTYALCRHPGVLWFALLLFGLVLVTKAHLMITASIVWLIADVLLVLVQDRVSFPRMFPDYPEYRQTTPFLVPTGKSIRVYLDGARESLARYRMARKQARLQDGGELGSGETAEELS